LSCISENENKIGWARLPRGENRVFRPIKLYKTSYDLGDEEEARLLEEELAPEKIAQRVAEWSDEERAHFESLKAPIEEEEQTASEHCLHQRGVKPTVSDRLNSQHINGLVFTHGRPLFASTRPGYSSS
jgi:hypothetical protein